MVSNTMINYTRDFYLNIHSHVHKIVICGYLIRMLLVSNYFFAKN